MGPIRDHLPLSGSPPGPAPRLGRGPPLHPAPHRTLTPARRAPQVRAVTKRLCEADNNQRKRERVRWLREMAKLEARRPHLG